MKLDELRKISKKMISRFVDELGYDGKIYVESNKTPIMFKKIEKNAPGKFYTADSISLKVVVDNLKIPNDKKDFILNTGLIAINSFFKDEPIDDDAIVTCIHEMFHSSRMILAHVPKSHNKNLEAIISDDGRFVVDSLNYEDKYVDPNQDILTDSIDTSKLNVIKYSNLSDDEKETMYLLDEKYGDKLSKQRIIDETLIEMMSISAYLLSTDKFDNIMDIVKHLNNRSKDNDSDFYHMTNIIIRHNNLDLFKWMIDPLSYQNDDITYDYFSHYITDEDQDDVRNLYENTDLLPDYDDEIDRIASEVSQSRKKQ